MAQRAKLEYSYWRIGGMRLNEMCSLDGCGFPASATVYGIEGRSLRLCLQCLDMFKEHHDLTERRNEDEDNGPTSQTQEDS